MSIRMTPKLTDRHIMLLPFTAMRVNFAVQFLSLFVATGINILCAWKYLPDEANAIAEFVETFDKLFNAFYSASTNKLSV